MPHVIEPAPSGRATCRGCGRRIAAGERRFGERLPNPYDDKGGEMTHWFHLACAAFKRPEPFVEALAATSDPVDDRAALEREARLGVSHRRLPRVNTIERAPSGRAACRHCRETIARAEWRISLVYYEDGRFAPSGYIHVRCAHPYLETTDIVARLKHFSPALNEADLVDIQAELQPRPADERPEGTAPD